MIISNKLSDKIAYELSKQQIIEESEATIYSYCLSYLFDYIFFIGSILFLGAILNCFLLSLIMLICIIPLRSFAGGIHLNSTFSCGLFSYLLIIAMLIAIPYLSNNTHISNYVWHFTQAISAITTILLAPVSSDTKQLTVRQKTKLEFLVIFYTILLCIIYYILYNHNTYLYCHCIVISQFVVCIGTIAGKIKYHKPERSNSNEA